MNEGKGKIALFYTANNVLQCFFPRGGKTIEMWRWWWWRENNRNEEEEERKMGIKKLRKQSNKIVKGRGVSKTLFAV